MAIRHVKTIPVKIQCDSTPFQRSVIVNHIITQRGLMIDDTIGPVIDLHMKDTPENASVFQRENGGFEHFVFVSIKLFDASMCEIRRHVYSRTLREYHTTQFSVFQRYRTPFESFEMYIDQMERPIYYGNPKIEVRAGDVILIEVLSPWMIDKEKSSIELQFIELLGHLGPPEILVV